MKIQLTPVTWPKLSSGYPEIHILYISRQKSKVKIICDYLSLLQLFLIPALAFACLAFSFQRLNIMESQIIATQAKWQHFDFIFNSAEK